MSARPKFCGSTAARLLDLCKARETNSLSREKKGTFKPIDNVKEQREQTLRLQLVVATRLTFEAQELSLWWWRRRRGRNEAYVGFYMKERLRSELEDGDRVNRRKSKSLGMYEGEVRRLSVDYIRSAWLVRWIRFDSYVEKETSPSKHLRHDVCCGHV